MKAGGVDPAFYDCSNCPSYCCAYPDILVDRMDVRRLAGHFDLDPETARLRLTREGREPGSRVMRHVRDPVFGTVCRLLDPVSRRCIAHAARPSVCRRFPGSASCHYYRFLMAERRLQENPALIARAYNVI